MGYELLISIIAVLVMFGILFSNSLVIASVIKFKDLHTVPNIFIANLAAADILSGIFIPVFHVFVIFHERVAFCYIYIYSATIPVFASLIFLMLIAVERTLCIAKPFFYQRNMTVSRASLLSVGGWVFACMNSYWPLILPDVRVRGKCGIETFRVQKFWITYSAIFLYTP